MEISIKEIEAIEKVNLLTERIRMRKEEFLSDRPVVCSERLRLATESWKETEGDPLLLRRAKLFKKILEGIPVVIREGELIVGSQTRTINGVYPDLDTEDPALVEKEMFEEKLLYGDERTEAILLEEDKKAILDAIKYWKGKTLCAQGKTMLREFMGNKYDDFEEAVMWTGIVRNMRARTMDFGKVLNTGLNGVISEINSEREKLRRKSVLNQQEADKDIFLQSAIIACEAVIHWAKRYAVLARLQAKEEKNAKRKSELEKIAEICEHVPANPARNFYEAAQSFYFALLALNLEMAGSGEAPGRTDQYLYPFYRKDVDEGRLSPQEAGEILASCWLKLMEIHSCGSAWTRKVTQGSQFLNMTIAGVKEDGSDAVNAVSFLLLQVIRQIRSIQPHVSLRYHDGINQEFFFKALECNRDHGGGIPAFFNDKTALVNLVGKGIPLSEARNWVPQGCVERTIYPSSSLLGAGPFYNLAKILELTLNNGVDPRTGKQLGLTTGKAADFSSFEELYDAFKKQAVAVAETCATGQNLWLVFRSHYLALPYNSALVPDCIQTGVDLVSGGGKWTRKFMAALRPFGNQNVANSLAAIKKLVFEEKKITMDELLDALRVNFEGKEDLRRMLERAPKWGNDDDYVDDINSDIFRWTEEHVHSFKNPWGEPYLVSRQGPTIHYQFGKVVGALPDGRKAWTPLADGTMSPMYGTDKKGPSAVLNSAAKPDQIGSEATLLNQKFNPSTVQTREGIRKWGSLIKTYFDRFGHHVQFNIVSKGTLLDAKKHPEKYRDLVIRVAGFSAYFIDLPDDLQNEIIARTEQELA
jgi:pyruvate formate-lyase/glycerol dehydratase family glycyl radical enzyme